MLKLYYAPGTCALATHIALEEAGAAYSAGGSSFEPTSRTARNTWRSTRRAACRLAGDGCGAC